MLFQLKIVTFKNISLYFNIEFTKKLSISLPNPHAANEKFCTNNSNSIKTD